MMMLRSPLVRQARLQWSRRSSRSSCSTSTSTSTSTRAATPLLVAAAAASTTAALCCCWYTTTTLCDYYYTTTTTSLNDFDEEHPSGYSEQERFQQCLDYHRALLFDYKRRWQQSPDSDKDSVTWPTHIPSGKDIPALELDLRFCQASPAFRKANCHDLQFRIASYFLQLPTSLKSSSKSQEDDDGEESPFAIQRRMKEGYKLVKELAENGHADGMCLYGEFAWRCLDRTVLLIGLSHHSHPNSLAMILNDGRVPDIDAKPEEAVVWFRRCVDLHRHIAATYELAICLYTGEGVVENPDNAFRLFRQAAQLGHAGAAYMLGECLLDGIGAKRDRANALEWLVTAAELGHSLARHRVMMLLEDEALEEELLNLDRERQEEAIKWLEDVSSAVTLERRHTVGAAGPLNPQLTERRRTKVMESRQSR